MAQSDVNRIIDAYYANNFTNENRTIKDCSRSKAYSIKRTIDKRLNQHDLFCEVRYNADTKTAVFDIVT
jgi:hypothetical protein